ncbi:hypothetical protein [Massilia cavernae]|uniref:Uncharacterized protein n=1 Tax=Massilia cavernae TaxID=2320864 RepID=A0A418Y7V4_9BURK|nr:hypothetical protein [Massilia cavernae]RJG27106.1 hypothetical protein D3872_01715 [Massilia cavernae]
MSIAVSAVVKPSRLLRAALAIHAALNLGAALYLLGPGAGAFAAPHAIAACCLVVAAAAAHACACPGNKRLIDISGLGEMRVTVQQDTGGTARHNTLSRLLPGSTIWPGSMLLLVRSEGGKTAPVAVLPDCVGAQQFRALAVAVRAIGGHAAQDQDFFDPHKIL